MQSVVYELFLYTCCIAIFQLIRNGLKSTLVSQLFDSYRIGFTNDF